MKGLLILLLCNMISVYAAGQLSLTDQWDQHTYVSSDFTLPYVICQPDLDSKPAPLFIFLHGSGERGTDNQLQLKNVAHRFATESFQQNYPSTVLVPQCPPDDYWSSMEINGDDWIPRSTAPPTKSMDALISLVDSLISTNKIDPARVYIAGLSMGGYGTYDMLSRRPELFASAVAICGGADLSTMERYHSTPIRIFHGAKDTAVPVQESRDAFARLKSLGAEHAYYIEYPEGDHLIWDKAFEGNTLLDWIFSQVR